MRVGKTFVVFVFLLHVLLAALPFIPKANSWLPDNPTSLESLRISLLYIGSHFAVLGAWLGTVLMLRGQDDKSLLDLVTHRLSGVVVRQLRDDEFYLDFLNHAQRATSYVLISYFAPHPPDVQSNDNLRRYYDDIENVMRRNPGTTFRRLVRRTTENALWAQTLCQRLQGYPNVSVASISDQHESREMPLAMSVQVIDDRYVWLVAIESHLRSGQYRDLFIDDPLVAKAMVKYYDKLWDIGTLFMNAGHVTEEGRIAE